MKKLFIVLILLLVLAGAGYIFLTQYSGKVVRSAILRYGPPITQTTIELDEVTLSLFDGAGSLNHLVVGNPEGFSAPYAFKVSHLGLDLKPRSLLSEVIVIESIRISEPHFVYERTLTNSNLKQLQKNIQAAAAKGTTETTPEPGQAEPPETAPAKPKKLIIESFIFEKGTVTVQVAGQKLDVDLPKLEMKDLGAASGGGTPTEIAEEVMVIVLRNVIQAATEALAGDGGALLQDAGSQLQEKGKDALESVRGLFE